MGIYLPHMAVGKQRLVDDDGRPADDQPHYSGRALENVDGAYRT